MIIKKKIPEGIYAVITEKFCRNGSSVETLRQVLAAGVKLIQLREKNYSKDKVYLMAKQFRRLTEDAGATLIINDYPDIAAMAGADGVHLGQDDTDFLEAKKKYSQLIIGVSTHNAQEAALAQAKGADYINIGPIFATKTKETGKYKPIGCVNLKKIVKNIRVPFSVMGGIKTGNIAETAAVGARIFAMITEITMAEDIKNSIAGIIRIEESRKKGDVFT
jgi:thiamine-phosphate pyrophosphorylase